LTGWLATVRTVGLDIVAGSDWMPARAIGRDVMHREQLDEIETR